MPDQTPCRRCGTIGFVRWETVIRAGEAFRTYYCGRCESTWDTDEDGNVLPAGRDRSPRTDRATGR